jgi:hypothetical protein
MHIGGLVAEVPAGRSSDFESLESPTSQGSFPAATRAPPESFQPAAPASKPPSEASVYGDVMEVFEGKLNLERVLVRLGNAWYAVGPVAVLALAGEPEPSFDLWPVLVLALAAQFTFDFANAAAHARIAHGISPRVFVRHLSTAWMVDAALSPVALLAAIVAFTDPWAFLLLLPLAALLRTFARERRARVDHALELTHAYRGTALLLGDVVEADDAYTGTHSRDVVSLSIAVAEELGLDARGRRDTEFVALLHDVGKIRIPNEIINKPGPLTPEERALVETHTVVGEEMLDRVGGVLGNVGALVRSCHERYDGGGYPDGSRGARRAQALRRSPVRSDRRRRARACRGRDRLKTSEK